MDTEAVLELIQEVAAEVINPRFRALAEHDIVEKRPGDLVTIADRESEAILTRELAAAHPDAVVIGEEAVFATPALLEGIEQHDHVFLVDPVDGTRNFARGSADHAVMVSELRRGETTRGWIWQPQHHRAYVAERGAGATRNGQLIPRRDPGEIVDAPDGRTSRSRWWGMEDPFLGTVSRSAWCCGVDYPNVVDGIADYLVYVNVKPWDHAPGSLLLAEIGGAVLTRTGEPYTAGYSGPGLFCASTQALAERVRTQWPTIG